VGGDAGIANDDVDETTGDLGDIIDRCLLGETLIGDILGMRGRNRLHAFSAA
jgi:hypothetical protein